MEDRKEQKEMTELERQACRRLEKHNEMMKDPAYRAAQEYAQRKASEQKKREEILKRFEAGYVPPLPQAEPNEKTEKQMRMEAILKNFM